MALTRVYGPCCSDYKKTWYMAELDFASKPELGSRLMGLCIGAKWTY